MKSRARIRTAIAVSGVVSVLLLNAGCTDDLVSETPVKNTVSSKPVPLLFLADPQTAILTEDKKIIVEGERSVLPGQRAKIRLYKSGRRFLCVEGHRKCWQILAIPDEENPD